MTTSELPGPTWDTQPGVCLSHLAVTDPEIAPQMRAMLTALQTRFEDVGYRVDETEVTISEDLKPGQAHIWTMFQAKDMSRQGAFQIGMDFGISDLGIVSVYFVAYQGRAIYEDGTFDLTAPYSLKAIGDWSYSHGRLDWSKGLVRPNIYRREPILNQLRELQAFDPEALLTDGRVRPLLDKLEP